MGDKVYQPAIIVTDAGTANDESRVTDPSTGNSIVVPATQDGIAQGIKDVNK